MDRLRWARELPAVFILATTLVPRALTAQGVTTAAVEGRVTRRDGAPVPGAAIEISNGTNGQRWRLRTGSTGRYAVEHVTVGGPYVIDARAPGFKPARAVGIVLTLGERLGADFILEPAAIELDPVAVTAITHPLLNPGRTGPAQHASDSTILALPNINRDYVDLALLSPQVTLRPFGAVTIGGQNQLFNNVQIDGGSYSDLYLARAPGGPGANVFVPPVLPRAISLETVQEFQVLVAPFDVRQGGFTGGALDAVTRSGTNTHHGSAFAFLENQSLAGHDPAGQTWQYGASMSGPLVPDRIHYLFNAELQDRVAPDPGPLITDTVGGADVAAIGISHASAARFQSILTNTWGLDPGTLGPVDGRLPARDLFGKITAHLGTNSRVEISHHHAHGDRRGIIQRDYGDYHLSSQAEDDRSTANTFRLIWHGVVDGRWSNEVIISYLRLRDVCHPNASFPLIEVLADNGSLWAGSGLVCPTSSVAQSAFEVTYNLTVTAGRHVLTAGTHEELLKFQDSVLVNSRGSWRFPSLDALERGDASRYAHGFAGPSRPPGPVVDFRAWQFGLYLQDRWTPAPRLTVTAGMRVDVPFLPDTNPTNVVLRDNLGIDTGRLPSGNVLWSPRLGISYSLRADGGGFLRGGVGLFSGRPPYRWLGNVYRTTGGETLVLQCDGARAAPPFDPVNQPVTCDSAGPPPLPEISYFDREVKFPQTLKLAVGLDHRLPWNFIGTLDMLYSRGVRQFYYSDANLAPPSGVAAGEGGRPLYGTIGPGGVTVRRDTAFRQVFRVSNRSGDRAVSLAAQVQRRFGDRLALSALYAYARAQDLASLANYDARPTLVNVPLDGTLEDRRLATSSFETPHRVAFTAAVALPLGVHLALLYAGQSGTPYTYTIIGDANADGFGTATFQNDVIYVPRDSQDIALDSAAQWAGLNRFIEGEECLRGQRGRLMRRNSCRNPWFGLLHARLTKVAHVGRGRSLEITADVFNLMNLLSRGWGQYRYTTLDPSRPALRLTAYDAANGRGVYRVMLPSRDQVLDAASRWRMQLGARYRF